jgi:hypothetical protein
MQLALQYHWAVNRDGQSEQAEGKNRFGIPVISYFSIFIFHF